jgi:hypothetical protein
MSTKTHWKKLTNPDYLGAYALEQGEERTLTIKGVKQELVQGSDGKKEECIVVRFIENEKPMIMNKTNLKTIAKLYGSYIEDWAGKRITVYVEKVKAFGDLVEALRIKAKVPQATMKEPEVICEDCGRVIRPASGASVAQIVKRSQELFSKNLCMNCAIKARDNNA